MSQQIRVPDVGAPDFELRNSPIFDHYSEEYDAVDLEYEAGACYFNGVCYPLGPFVASGEERLRYAGRGVWVRVGPTDPR